MKIIGLCGQSGSGKTTVSDYFSSKGIPILNADKIYTEITSNITPCLLKIGENFGEEVIKGGKLNRKLLSQIIYIDENKRLLLNSITHPYVISEMKERIEKFKIEDHKACLIDAPLLFEADIDKWCYIIIGIIAPIQNKIDRIMQRDGISSDNAKIRLSKQYNDDFLKRNCDIIINNDNNIQKLYSQCDEILNKI